MEIFPEMIKLWHSFGAMLNFGNRCRSGISGVVETDAEVWITGVVETDAEVWISGVVTTGGRVHWLLSLSLPCSESLLITELLALLFPSVLHTLG